MACVPHAHVAWTAEAKWQPCAALSRT